MNAVTARTLKLIHLMKTLVLGLLLAPMAVTRAADPKEVFERRILPIFKSPNPSSCTECHLAGVDLKIGRMRRSKTSFGSAA